MLIGSSTYQTAYRNEHILLNSRCPLANEVGLVLRLSSKGTSKEYAKNRHMRGLKVSVQYRIKVFLRRYVEAMLEI